MYCRSWLAVCVLGRRVDLSRLVVWGSGESRGKSCGGGVFLSLGILPKPLHKHRDSTPGSVVGGIQVDQ
jgi:hypothetical protein